MPNPSPTTDGATRSTRTEASRGPLSQPPSGQVTRYPRWIYVVLSLATALWLLVQTAAGIIQTDHAYPVTAYAMFSQPSDGTFVGFGLEATQADGRTEPVPGADFGLTPLQLRNHLVRTIGETAATAHPQAGDRLGTLARIWEERHDDRLDRLVLWRSEQHLDDDEPTREEVASWER